MVQTQVAQSGFFGPPRARGACRVCGRELSDPVSVANGIGPICASHGHGGRESDRDTDGFDIDFDPVSGDVVCRRDPTGKLHFNIPRRFTHHSPDGFEFGYGGSGPADFALNIVAAFLAIPDQPAAEMVKLFDGRRVPRTIWDLHQQFKWDFVARLPREGGTISGHAIRAWLAARGPWNPGAIR